MDRFGNHPSYQRYEVILVELKVGVSCVDVFTVQNITFLAGRCNQMHICDRISNGSVRNL